ARPRLRARVLRHHPLGHDRVSRAAQEAHGRARREEIAAGRTGSAGGMIIGIGSDLIDIRRIEKSLERHGQRFVQRIYTEVEQAKSEKRAARAASYAKRFAAKEA